MSSSSISAAAVSLLASAAAYSGGSGDSSGDGGGRSSSSSSDGGHSGGSLRTPHELLFSNRTESSVLLLLCFCWSLLSVLAPSLCMRHEQFSRLQVFSLSVWHTFAAGVLLSSAWVVFLPNALSVGDNMRLASPALPFVLLFLSMLVPLLLDKLMLWLCSSAKPATHTSGGDGEWPTATPTGELTPSQPSTPRHVMTMTPQQQQQQAGSSRKSSAAMFGGFQADSAMADERKMAVLGGGLPQHGRTASRTLQARGGGGGMEESPLLDVESGSLITPKTTPRGSIIGERGVSVTPTRGAGAWYGSAAARSVDASEFKARQSYLARCALCKENITTSKGVAYHGAGCPLKSFHAFSFSSRWMQGLRGRRSLQRDIVMHEEAANGGDGTLAGPPVAVGWSLLCYVLVLSIYNLCLAGGVNLQEAARLYSHAHTGASPDSAAAVEAHASWVGEMVRVGLVALVMFCFTGFYGFSLGMMLALHRVALTSLRALAAMLCFALSLPGACVLNYALANYAGSDGSGGSDSGSGRAYDYYLLVCQCFCVGILLYAAFLDLLLEEWARRDAMWAKYAGFAVGAGIVLVVAIWAPL